MEFVTFRLKDTEYTRVSKTIHNKHFLRSDNLVLAD